jgi:P-type Ca2+ transporter type 2C
MSRTRELQDAPRAGGTGLDLSGFTGLSEDDACRKIEQDGPNEIASQQKRGLLEIVIEVIREPMFLMLVAAGTLYLLMGSPGDALMLLGFVFVVMAITIIQERRTERALDALRDLSSPRALVIRGGLRRRVAGREVVRGDILVLSEGDRVPADAILRRAINLSVDESLLTGESVPVRKTPSAVAQGLERPGGDDLPSVYSGTLVTAGQGIAEVVNTGGRTELGKIGKALQQIQPEATSLQKETGRMVRTLALVGLAACGLVVVMYALTRGGTAQVWKEGLLAGIAMAMAILPEEFPVVLTIFLALGAWRISRSRVLTRRMPAIETLGAATVLCVDKTGTLTRNQMTLKKLAIDGRTATIGADIANLSEEFHGLLENAILASKRDPFDPMELALQAAGDRLLMQTEHLHPEWSLLREYPLTPQLLAVSQVWKLGAGEDVVVASKGAPEAIAALCRLSPDGRAAVAGEAAALAAEGLRVLGVACARLTVGSLPGEHSQLALEFLGLVGLEDPLRATVPAAVTECRTAGIRIVMITGDYPATAQSIARQAGLENPEKVLTGPELERMSDEELAKQLKDVQVFARVVPEQKLRIVIALKANQEIVAMTGDGVNDAPALKAAHIGIAMGGRGTDVAREAASLVLLDDDFSSIVGAVRLGRRIFDNIKKAIAFIFAAHIPIAGLSMLPVFFSDWPLLLFPVHIVFLELIIDPSCSLIFEAEEAEANVMKRPPRSASERLFSLATVGVAVLQGLSVLAACLGVFLLYRSSQQPDTARALSFLTLVVSLVVIILANRSWTHGIVSMLSAPNSAFWWVVGGTAAFLATVLLVPVVRGLFHFAPLRTGEMALGLGAGVICAMWFELLRLLMPRMRALDGASR